MGELIVKILKKYILCLTTAFIIGAGVFSYNAITKVTEVRLHGEHKLFSDADELSSNADVILIGSPVKKFEEEEATVKLNEFDRIGNFYTLTEFKVKEVLKGEIETEGTIEIAQPAAITTDLDKIGKVFLHPEDYTVMKKGSKYLLFLRIKEDGRLEVISGNQGKHNIDKSDNDELEQLSHDSQYNELKKKVYEKYANKSKEEFH